MTRVAIVTPSLTTADAVSNDILGESDALTRNGHKVKIFSDLARVWKFLKNPTDILIYHHSRGWHPGVQLVRELQCRRVIRYHNVTPAEFFAGFSRTDQDLCERGRSELTELAAPQCACHDRVVTEGDQADLGAVLLEVAVGRRAIQRPVADPIDDTKGYSSGSAREWSENQRCDN